MKWILSVHFDLYFQATMYLYSSSVHETMAEKGGVQHLKVNKIKHLELFPVQKNWHHLFKFKSDRVVNIFFASSRQLGQMEVLPLWVEILHLSMCVPVDVFLLSGCFTVILRGSAHFFRVLWICYFFLFWTICLISWSSVHIILWAFFCYLEILTYKGFAHGPPAGCHLNIKST